MENILEQTMAHELIIVKDSVYNMCDNIICFYSTIMAAVFLVVRPFFVLYNKTIGTNLTRSMTLFFCILAREFL